MINIQEIEDVSIFSSKVETEQINIPKTKSKKQFINSLKEKLSQDIGLDETEISIPNLIDLIAAFPQNPTKLSTELANYYISRLQNQREQESVALFIVLAQQLNSSYGKKNINNEYSLYLNSDASNLMFKIMIDHTLQIKPEIFKGLSSDVLTSILEEFFTFIKLSTRILNQIVSVQQYQNILIWFDYIIESNYQTIFMHSDLKKICKNIKDLVQGYAQYIEAYEGLQKYQELKSTIILPEVKSEKRVTRIIF